MTTREAIRATLSPSATREGWLNGVMHRMAPWLEENLTGATGAMDSWRVSVGWPGGGSKRLRVGECWGDTASKDGRTEMFISPVLDDPEKVAEVLLHEMCHAALGVKEGHGKAFKRLATAVGLTCPPSMAGGLRSNPLAAGKGLGPMKATVAGPALTLKLRALIREVGDYPHAGLKLGEGIKKQSTRLIKANCPDCGYTIRLTAKWISVGLPTCPCGCRMVAG
jgi:hypothetical protein